MADTDSVLDEYGQQPASARVNPWVGSWIKHAPPLPDPARYGTWKPGLSETEQMKKAALDRLLFGLNFVAPGRGAAPRSPVRAGVAELGVLGGLGTGVAASAPVDPNERPSPFTQSIFAGPKARTADLAALERARSMAAKGTPREDIWSKEGWFQAPDGKWRFEIDDSGSRVRKFDDEFLSVGRPMPSDMAWKHDDLFANYPHLGDVTYYVSQSGNPSSASFVPVGGGKIVQEGGRSSRTNFLHEMQHAVQDYERFAQGSNPNVGHKADDVRREARAAYEANQKRTPDADDELLRELGIAPPDTSKPWDELTPRQQLGWFDAGRGRLYTKSAGEVEARTVQNRMDMTADERRARPPWLDYDIPENQQIVRFDDAPSTADILSRYTRTAE